MATKRELRALRKSICRGVREQVRDFLLVAESPALAQMWDDPRTGRIFEGPHVEAECQRIHAQIASALILLEQEEA